MSDYWIICIEEAFEESGIKVTRQQIENVASFVESGHENYGMAHGYDCIRAPAEKKDTSLKLGKPHCYSSSFCRSSGYLEENMSVTCKNTGQVFYFNNRKEAENFVDRNG